MKCDFVVFGASGYTGQYVVEELAVLAHNGENITFAIAGRNQGKLEKVISSACNNTKLPLDGITIIQADVNDHDSLVEMASQGKVVINCVGPYRFHGEKVVKACIEAGSDYIDICGEPEFLESVQLKYNEDAIDNNVHIVGSCGFDSVPADLGVVFLKNAFTGELNSVEMIVTMDDESQGHAPINATTLECAVHGYSNRHMLSRVRKQLFPTRPPSPQTKLKPRGTFSWCEEAGRWCLPNLASDKSVVRRTQIHNALSSNKPPIQFEVYFGVSSILSVFGAMVFGIIFLAMTSTEWTKKLMIKHPSFFTFGFFSNDGAKRSELVDLKFCVTYIGKGWATGRPEDESTNPPDTKLVAKMTGPDPGYFGTAKLITQCGLVVLKERNKIPGKGGVHTPGLAFENTTLKDRLEGVGIKFSY